MQPGDIYKLDFAYQSPGVGSRFRPALCMYADSQTNVALLCKVTTSEPNPRFPYREEIVHWPAANLDQQSWVQYDWYNAVDSNTVKHKYVGTMDTNDFQRIFDKFKTFHNL
ncbi:type II toxin-antitoxin system PemK/MazF family toxin [Heyndrickxia acidiproducens]|uniref:type II toxin-antitoxin system PemK/MazF family toxin n=1 Tax=Heyndrickxia acidiproducens TaxID=1121084 RepID=UPI003BF495B4